MSNILYKLNIYYMLLFSIQDCVKHKATVSVLAVRDVTLEQAKEAVEKVFDRCYNDLEPIGRRVKGKRTDFELAYAEAFLMGYDQL